MKMLLSPLSPITMEVIMLKTPRFLLAACILLALAFTFSCSGDDGNDGPPATLPSSSSDAGVSQLPSSASAPSSSSEDATLHSSSSNDEELVEVSSSSEEESSSSATPPPPPPPPPPPYYPPNPPVTSSSSSLEHSSSSLEHSSSSSEHSSSLEHCSHFVEETEIEHYGKMKKKFCDKRDGHEYVYVEIGTQTWMAENLNYAAEGSRCYDNNEDYCDTYGRLYDWTTAMTLPECMNSINCTDQIQSPHKGICPDGWHIPDMVNGVNILSAFIANNSNEGVILKTKDLWESTQWTTPDNNLDTYGFSALPAGQYCHRNSTTCALQYAGRGTTTGWWLALLNTSSPSSAYYKAVTTTMNSPNTSSVSKQNFYSIRCLKD